MKKNFAFKTEIVKGKKHKEKNPLSLLIYFKYNKRQPNNNIRK